TTADDIDLIVAGRSVYDHAVGCTIARATARRIRQVDTNLIHVGSAEVIDRDGVGTTQHVELDMLDTAEIHRHIADIASQADAVAIGRNVDLLGDVGAVEQQRISAVLAFDNVAAI